MAVAYAVEFELPYFVLMEDDTTWGFPREYRSRLNDLVRYAKSIERTMLTGQTAHSKSIRQTIHKGGGMPSTSSTQ